MPVQRILVVEDDESSRDFLTRRLRAKNYEVFSSDGSGDVLESITEIQPHAILLDIMLPGVSGLEVLQAIREYWSPEQIAVILVSGLDSSEDVVRGLELGANDYVAKPINFPVLLARLRTSLASVDSFQRLTQEHETERKLSELKVLAERLGTALDKLKHIAGSSDNRDALLQEVTEMQRLLDQQHRCLSFEPIEMDFNAELLSIRDFR